MNLNKSSRLIRYGISVAAVAAAVLLTLLIRFVFQLNPTPLIIIAVAAAAWYGGKYPGLLACLLADLAIDYFFEEPAYEFTPAPAHFVRFGILAVISLLTSARKNAEDKLKVKGTQQAAVARLGQQALSRIPLNELFDEAVTLVRQTLNVDYSAVCEIVPEKDKMRFVAGSGWNENVVGFEFDYTASSSLAGAVLGAGQPVIFNKLDLDTGSFTSSKILKEHRVRNGLGVIISQHQHAFGVLGAFDRRDHFFSEDDVNFLQSVANILAEAIERMRAEESVREQREWLRTTLASIGDAVIAADRNGAVTFMNPVAETLTGWDEESADGRQLKEVFHVIDEEKRHEIENPFAKVMRHGSLVGLANHTILISRDGKEIPIDDSAAPIRDESGNITGVVLVFHDITGRKQEEKAKEFLSDAAGIMTASLDLEETLSSLADLTVPALADICIIDLISGKNDIQRLAVTYADSTKAELVEAIKHCADFDPAAESGIPNVLRTGKPEFYAEGSDLLSSNLVCGSADPADFRQLTATSAMIVPLIAHGRTLGVISLLLTEKERRFHEREVQLIEDFAHRAALAIDNARLYRTLQEANRIKDEFLATLSHELRTPLNAILGWSTLMRSAKFPPEQVRTTMETIERNARLQKQIVEDVLDVSGIITGKFRLEILPVDLALIIEAAIETVRPSAIAKDIRIAFSPQGKIPKVSGDAGRLQQVMWNLLSNAVKFTPKNGQIEITLEINHSNARIRVKDSGQGIHPDFLPFVFDRFRQADSSKTRLHGGLGLGLAIVRYIVELHGGEVRAESPGENSGATFIIDFPIIPVFDNTFPAPEIEYSKPDIRKAENQNSLKNLQILVVEDDADSRLIISTILEQYGAAVKSVSSSKEAMVRLEDEKPDILISDIGMPEEDGYALIKKVRSLYPDNGQIPAIALTAYASEEDRVQALTAGYQIHLAKPVEPDDLVLAIKNLLA